MAILDAVSAAPGPSRRSCEATASRGPTDASADQGDGGPRPARVRRRPRLPARPTSARTRRGRRPAGPAAARPRVTRPSERSGANTGESAQLYVPGRRPARLHRRGGVVERAAHHRGGRRVAPAHEGVGRQGLPGVGRPAAPGGAPGERSMRPTPRHRPEPADSSSSPPSPAARLGRSSVGEREAGVASVSAPVFDRLGDLVAVVSVSGPSERIAHRRGAAVRARGHDRGARDRSRARRRSHAASSQFPYPRPHAPARPPSAPVDAWLTARRAVTASVASMSAVS